MNRTNKIMLIGNIILALALMSIMFTACTSSGSIQSLQNQDNQLISAFNQIQNQVNTNKSNISTLQAQLQALQENFTQNFNNLKTYIDAKTQ